MPENFHILMVCTANLCRSPLMEHILRQSLIASAADPGWTVGSAGMQATEGKPMHPNSQRILSERGIQTGAWLSRQLCADFIRRADLILTAGAQHRSAVVALFPAAVQRTFLLRPFSALSALSKWPVSPGAAEPAHPARPTDLIMAAARARSRLPPELRDTELDDPIGRPLGRFRECADAIASAIDPIVSQLCLRAAAH